MLFHRDPFIPTELPLQHGSAGLSSSPLSHELWGQRRAGVPLNKPNCSKKPRHGECPRLQPPGQKSSIQGSETKRAPQLHENTGVHTGSTTASSVAAIQTVTGAETGAENERTKFPHEIGATVFYRVCVNKLGKKKHLNNTGGQST